MFKDISDDIVSNIMSYGDIKDLMTYKSINKYTEMIYDMNIERLCYNLINKKCNFVNSNSAYNFQMENNTVSVTKNNNASLQYAMYLSELF